MYTSACRLTFVAIRHAIKTARRLIDIGAVTLHRLATVADTAAAARIVIGLFISFAPEESLGGKALTLFDGHTKYANAR